MRMKTFKYVLECRGRDYEIKVKHIGYLYTVMHNYWKKRYWYLPIFEISTDKFKSELQINILGFGIRFYTGGK